MVACTKIARFMVFSKKRMWKFLFLYLYVV